MGTYEDDEGTEIVLDSGSLVAETGWTLLEGSINKVGPETMVHLEFAFASNAAPAALVLPDENFYPPQDVHTEDGHFTVRGPAGVNAEHTITITGTPTGGNVALAYAGYGTVTLPFGETATSAQALFDTVFGAGNTHVAGGPLPGSALTVSFQNALAARAIALPTVTPALTGGTEPSATATNTTVGAVAGEIDYSQSTASANAGPVVCDLIW